MPQVEKVTPARYGCSPVQCRYICRDSRRPYAASFHPNRVHHFLHGCGHAHGHHANVQPHSLVSLWLDMIEYFKAIQTPCSNWKVANDILPK